MTWVISHLKSLLRREKMIGTTARDLVGDKRYAISKSFSDDRIPQLKKAIEILERESGSMPIVQSLKIERKQVIHSNQLTLWK